MDDDEVHVWVRSSDRGLYLHADDNGVSVSLHASRASLNAAWVVHLYQSPHHGRCVLFYSAAYGLYLTATNEPAPFGHRGFRVVLSNYNQLDLDQVMWKATRPRDTAPDTFRFQSVTGLSLRANGKILTRHRGVTIDGTDTTMMHWVVEPIPCWNIRPPLQDPVKDHLPGDLSVRLRLRNPSRERQIRFVRADDDGVYAEGVWEWLNFTGRSVLRLRNQLASRLGLHSSTIIMCVRAGRYGRLTPLFVNLPAHGCLRIEIIVFRSGTPAAYELLHPRVDAE